MTVNNAETMTPAEPQPKIVTAALIVIGEEILSGRTSDQNIAYIGAYLARAGIALREVRVVGDIDEAIIAAVNELRPRFDYVFTTGGIGPTHDDITTDAIAKAFGVGVRLHEDAIRALKMHFSDTELTPARLRMARVPDGATLIDNAVSRAPGYRIANVIVMAGVPRIMQVMLDAVLPELDKGQPVLTRAVRIDVAEGDVAAPLAAVQDAHPRVQIGSYPFFEQKRLGTYVVLRSPDATELESACADLWKAIVENGFSAVPAETR